MRSMATIRITQRRSQIGCNPKQRATLKAMGLGKINRVIEREDTPIIRGQVAVVSHLVSVEEVD